jgi:L-xylulose reductase
VPVTCDLLDCDATQSIVEGLLPIDLVVNNAGASTLHPFLDTPIGDFERAFNLNVRSVMQVSQIVARDMVRRRADGESSTTFSIVNVSSQASKVALANHTSYCTSKGALDQLTRMMALELGAYQIRVNAVNPTVVLTDMGKVYLLPPTTQHQSINQSRFHWQQNKC